MLFGFFFFFFLLNCTRKTHTCMHTRIRNVSLPEEHQSKPEQGGRCWHSRAIETLLLIIIWPCKEGPDVIESLWTNPQINVTADRQFWRKNRHSWQVGTLFKKQIKHQKLKPTLTFSLTNAGLQILEQKLQEMCLFTGCREFPVASPAPVFSPATKPTPYPAALTPPWNHRNGFLSLKLSTTFQWKQVAKLRVSVCVFMNLYSYEVQGIKTLSEFVLL